MIEAPVERPTQQQENAGDDPYLASAVISSAPRHFERVAMGVAASGHAPTGPVFRELTGMAIALDRRDIMARLLHVIIAPSKSGHTPQQMSALAEWLDALGQRKSSIVKLAEGPRDDLSNEVERAEELDGTPLTLD